MCQTHKLLSLAVSAAVVLSPLTGMVPEKASASASQAAQGAQIPVEAYVTTWDKSKLLQKEPDTLFASGDTSPDALTIHVDETVTYQEMEGYGASLTDSSAYVIQNYMDAAERQELMTKLFDPVTGAGFSYLRLPVGASDFSVSAYTFDDMPEVETDPELEHFTIAHDLEYIIPVLKQALSVNPNLKIMGSPWSAPGWMKTTGKLQKGKLLPEYYGAYAQYFVKFIQAYEAEGVPIDAVTIQNEPHYEPNDYPGMRMEPEDQAEFVKNHLGPAFEAADIDTKIIVWDHNWDEPNYPVDVLNDPQAKAYIAGSAFHGYAGSVDAQAKVHDLHPDKGLYFTESSGVYSYPIFGDNVNWDVSNLIIGSSRYWAKTVLKWNLALDENHGPTIGGCQDCRGVITVNSADGAVTLNEEYYAFGHAAKFVRPGAVRIKSNTFGSGSIEDVAFKNADGSKVLLVQNSSTQEQEFKVKWGDQSFRFTLPAKAVVTFKWSGTQIGESGINPYSKVEAEDYSAMNGIETGVAEDQGGGRYVGQTGNDEYISFHNTAFTAGTAGVKLRYASQQDAQVEFRLDSPDGPYIGGADLASTNGAQSWKSKTVPVDVAEGIHDLYIVFKGSVNLNWFQFTFDSVKDTYNYMSRNGDFEDGNLDNWSSWTPEGQDIAHKVDTDGPRGGSYKLTHWFGQAYEQSTYRTVRVPNGTYKASVWVKKGDNINSRLEVKNYGGAELHVEAGSSYIGDWKQLVIPNIRVTGGQVEIGVYSSTERSEWAIFDDFELTPVTTKAPAVPAGVGAPAVPSGVSAEVSEAGFDMELNWQTVEGVLGYKIYRSTVDAANEAVTDGVYADYKEIGIVSAEAPAYTDRGLRGNTTYYYMVTAFNGAGESAVSQAVNATTAAQGTDLAAPAVPTGLTAVPGLEQITLYWNHNVESDFTKYNVYVDGVKAASVDPVTETRYTVRGLVPGRSYGLSVSAVDQYGNESARSENVTAAPTASGIPVPFSNLNFELGSFEGWSEWHPGEQPIANFVDNDSPRGQYKLTHWAADAYQQSTYRTLQVPNGTYKVQVWARTGGGQETFRLEVKNFGGNGLNKDMKSASGSVWTPFSIDNIRVTNGQLEIGVYSNAKAGNWAAIDDFEIYSYAPAVPAGLQATAGSGQVALQWTANTEYDFASYKVYQDDQMVKEGVTGTSTTVTGLTNGTAYSFKISAVDAEGNESMKSAAVQATPVAQSSGPVGNVVIIPPEEKPAVETKGSTSVIAGFKAVEVNGTDGRSTSVVDVNAKLLKDAGAGTEVNKIVIEADAKEGHRVQVALPVDALNSLAAAKPRLTLTVVTPAGQYELPVQALADQLGADAAESMLVLEMATLAGEEKQQAADQAESQGAQLLAAPTEFAVFIKQKDESTALHSFGPQYVIRRIPLAQVPVDLNQASGVTLNEEGQWIFVPTVFEKGADGTVTAVLKTNHNSVYTVVQGSASFRDMEGHWAQASVEGLAARYLVNGVEAELYLPSKPVTRAEWVTLLVRALGLGGAAEESAFKDVSPEAWYADEVSAAVSAGLLDGFEDGTFRPETSITREQLAVTVMKAMGYAKAKTEAVAAGEPFTDADEIAAWAEEAVALSADAGILTGAPGSLFLPKEPTSRAEAAVVLERLLVLLR